MPQTSYGSVREAALRTESEHSTPSSSAETEAGCCNSISAAFGNGREDGDQAANAEEPGRIRAWFLCLVAEAHGSRTHPGQRLLPRRRFGGQQTRVPAQLPGYPSRVEISATVP